MVKIMVAYARQKQIQKCDVKITSLLYIFIFRCNRNLENELDTTCIFFVSKAEDRNVIVRIII